MDRDQIVKNLARKSLPNADFDRLVKFYSLDKICPTCNDRGYYRLEGEQHDCDCELQRLLYKHYLAANIPSRYHDICLEPHFIGADRIDVLRVTDDYLANFENYQHFGLGLTFAGAFGSGKTFAMCSVLKSLLKRGKSVYFITFDELINVWGASWSDDEAKQLLNDRLLTVDILGLDELKSDPRNAGGFLQNGLDNVIRHRTANRIPTLITTNMLPSQEEVEFPKVFSLLSESNERVYLTGEDVRGGIVARTNKELARNGERRPVC